MSTVFINGKAVACKAGKGKLTAAFPDVCLSPPPAPVGPIPVPYANTSFSKDLENGSKTVEIGGKPVAVKDSFYDTAPQGNEAGVFGSVVSKQTGGKAAFSQYSFDIKFEGRNVCRHGDLMTANAGGTTPFPNLEMTYRDPVDEPDS